MLGSGDGRGGEGVEGHRRLGFGVWGLGFGVWGLGFGVWGLGFGVWGLAFSVQRSCIELGGLAFGVRWASSVGITAGEVSQVAELR
ncbi:hypothetical protein [Paenibacillus oryzisoli]|uniref:hypothetical protein n=1 Tax=Paenibacillus oryzisoli TaxID=1850517 RepID=UPI000B07FFAE|nr:hypothetical protein [Paenibacillus oryzisoli]